ncbi:unnamed protein product, partial [Ectocarpus sp. 12 AP-2014]
PLLVPKTAPSDTSTRYFGGTLRDEDKALDETAGGFRYVHSQHC